MDPILPIAEVLLDPRMEAAPGRVIKVYWKAVAMLWHEAKRSGKPVLPRALVKDCAELVSRGLMLECEDGAFIPWVSDAWNKVVSVSNSRKEAAAKSVERRRMSAELLKTEGANAEQMPSKREARIGSKGKEVREEEKDIATQARRVGSGTWLTPFESAWDERNPGGEFRHGKAARFLHPLLQKHGSAAVVAAWERYLDATDVVHWSPSRFAETYGKWTGAARPPPKAESRTLREMNRARELSGLPPIREVQ